MEANEEVTETNIEVVDLAQLAGRLSTGLVISGFIAGVTFAHLGYALDVPWWVHLLVLAGETIIMSVMMRWSNRFMMRALLMVYRSGFYDGMMTAKKVLGRIMRFKGRGDTL